jgi:hypothetical protein
MTQAKQIPQPLPQSGGSFHLEAGKLTKAKTAPKPAPKTDPDTPTKDA